MTDEKIFAGILGHDPAALAYLYERHLPAIVRQILGMGGTEEDAFDVFQESVVVLYLNAKTGKFTLRADSSLATYLQAVAKNTWRAQRRKHRQLATVELRDQFATPPPITDDDLKERIDELETALSGLGEKCRRLLRLFYYEKLPLRRIAELMTYTERAAKNSKYRCVQRLRAKLRDQ